ncbi:MAG: hypothetical protein COX96_04395 [Candidatus Omnitrophica bacterium CG_4_10_14_0_2_um_filter_44_9]|nr:MAG: hypothetical protein COY78_03395 [Candidatus Omnitrophica bacterium CG_4_10_14_0_8_um_filter_44_12]PIZ84310.1 MAG: hypothetical protein COX96_04395 [Candidatus Omnitrophica bacterium CG_4_10_14_0_2_um_filter_44_9]
MNEVNVKYTGCMGFQVQANGHTLTVDLSKEKGGSDQGMNPQEVFMASLGSCIGVYVTRYCQNAKLDADDMDIHLDWSLSDDKTKIKIINIKIELPNADVGRRKDALLQVAHHCLIHNTIQNPPEIKMALSARDIS